jgi:hypothetical protein
MSTQSLRLGGNWIHRYTPAIIDVDHNRHVYSTNDRTALITATPDLMTRVCPIVKVAQHEAYFSLKL